MWLCNAVCLLASGCISRQQMRSCVLPCATRTPDSLAADSLAAVMQEYLQKMARGGGSGRHRKVGWLRKVDRSCNETCLAAADLGPYM